MLHRFNFWKLVLLSTPIFTCWNASNSHILQHQGPILLSVRCTPNQTDSDVTCSRSCDQGKITKGIETQSALRKTRFFFKKNNPYVFYFFNLNFLLFFQKKQVLFFFQKTQKPHSDFFSLHHAISPLFKLHNNDLLYLLWHSNLRINNLSHLVFESVVNSLQSGKAYNAHSKQKSHSHTNFAVSRQVYARALLVQHQSSVFLNIWFVMVQY